MPWRVPKVRLTQSAKPKEGATFVVAASDSNDTTRADYICDGTADEVEINQALNALPDSGGYVHLLEGTYSIAASIAIPMDNVSLIGAGRGTILQTNANINVVNINNRVSIIISNLYILGNATGATQTGIHIINQSNFCIITNCWVVNTRLYGVILEDSDDCVISKNNISGCAAGIRIQTGSSRNRITENNCSNNSVDGISIFNTLPVSMLNSVANNICDNNDFYGIEVNWSNDITISGNVCSNNGNSGIYLLSSSMNSISDNISTSNTEHGIYVVLSNNNNFNGNQCHANVRHGIYLWVSEGNTVTENNCRDNDVNDTATYDGISLFSNADNNVISSNRCDGNDRDGIRIDDNTCDKNIVTSNQLLGNTTGALTDNGTNTEIGHNITV